MLLSRRCDLGPEHGRWLVALRLKLYAPEQALRPGCTTAFLPQAWVSRLAPLSRRCDHVTSVVPTIVTSIVTTMSSMSQDLRP